MEIIKLDTRSLDDGLHPQSRKSLNPTCLEAQTLLESYWGEIGVGNPKP